MITKSHVSSVGSPVGRLRDVEVVDHHGALAEQRRLVHEAVHPRAAALGLARPVVGEEQAELAAVGVEHLEHAHVRVVADQVVALRERQAVELGRRAEDAVGQHPLQLQVRAQDGVVERAALLLDLLGVELPVPRLQPGAGVVVPERLGQVGPLGTSVGDGHRGEPLEDVRHGLRRPRGRVSGDVLRVVRVPEQLRALGTRAGQAQQRRPGVVRPGRAPTGRRAEHPLAQATVAQGGQRRLLRGQRELEEPAVLVTTGPGSQRGGVAGVVGQTVQLVLVGDQDRRPRSWPPAARGRTPPRGS